MASDILDELALTTTRSWTMGPDPKVNILLVDDQPSNLLALEAILQGLGENLVKARSGHEALRCLLHEEFALIIMDVQMPGMDGLETAALIRERDKTRHTPIIFLTAYERSDVQMFKGYSLGAVDYLTKPYVPEVLRSKASVFVELYRKAEQVKRQAALLRENQEREHERQLREEKQRWELERLREEAAREKRVAEEMARTVAEKIRAEELTRERARQQALVAELGQHALAGLEVGELLAEAVRLIATTIGVEYCAVFGLDDDGVLRMRAGVGWPRDEGDEAVALGPPDPQLTDEPVLVDDLAADARFAGTNLDRRHGAASGLTVPVRSADRPFGVLGAFAAAPRSFTRDDIHFLQAVANVLATAIQRKQTEDELAAVKDELAAQLAEMTRLHQLSARLSNTLELSAVRQEVLRAVLELQDADRGVLLALDRERQELVTAAVEGLEADRLRAVGAVPNDPALTRGGTGRRGAAVALHVQTCPPSLRPLAQACGLTSLTSTPLLTRAGDLIGVIVSGSREPRRLSDREVRLVELYARQAASAIDNARLYQEINEANQGKDEFLAMLAHELRNPLAPILTALEILRRTDVDPRTLDQPRETMERQIRHIARLIDDLLDISRITRGKIELRKEPLDLREQIERAVETSRPLIEARQHTLEVRMPAEPIPLLADGTRLEQIFANLLNNSAKYTEPGGRITVAAERRGTEVVVAVRDNGIGIAPAHLPKVFDLFMQADRSLDRSFGGLGIGLTLVRRLVELHGGRVQAYSAGLGQGSEFTVRLPLFEQAGAAELGRSEASGPTTAAETAERSAENSRRVLVVDDNRDAAETLALMLELHGHQVKVAHDGRSGLKVAREYQPDVILLDIGLPHLNGYEVARSLRANGPARLPLLVAMTGYGQEEDRRKSREAGFDRHLVKPVDPELLLRLLSEAARPTAAV
jgi:signal transduction histidine kinase/DNA-binding response OmpR family regulator